MARVAHKRAGLGGAAKGAAPLRGAAGPARFSVCMQHHAAGSRGRVRSDLFKRGSGEGGKRGGGGTRCGEGLARLGFGFDDGWEGVRAGQCMSGLSLRRHRHALIIASGTETKSGAQVEGCLWILLPKGHWIWELLSTERC